MSVVFEGDSSFEGDVKALCRSEPRAAEREGDPEFGTLFRVMVP